MLDKTKGNVSKLQKKQIMPLTHKVIEFLFSYFIGKCMQIYKYFHPKHAYSDYVSVFNPNQRQSFR